MNTCQHAPPLPKHPLPKRPHFSQNKSLFDQNAPYIYYLIFVIQMYLNVFLRFIVVLHK